MIRSTVIHPSDGQTDGWATAYSALSMLSHAKNWPIFTKLTTLMHYYGTEINVLNFGVKKSKAKARGITYAGNSTLRVQAYST